MFGDAALYIYNCVSSAYMWSETISQWERVKEGNSDGRVAAKRVRKGTRRAKKVEEMDRRTRKDWTSGKCETWMYCKNKLRG